MSGPSGVGKGTLCNLLFERHPDCFAFSVSHTTRNPRAGETNGVQYHFVSMKAFEDLIAQDGFVEHAQFGGNRYGTSKMTIEEQTKKGNVVLLDIEMEVRTAHAEPGIAHIGMLTCFDSIGCQANQEVRHFSSIRFHRAPIHVVGDPRVSFAGPRHRDGREPPKEVESGQEGDRVFPDARCPRQDHC